MKKKNNLTQHKISLWLSKDDAKELINKNYSVLIKYFSESQDAIAFYTIMTLGCYSPVVMVEYDRTAFTYQINNTRLTIDSNIKSSECNFNLFDENPIYTPILDNQSILEVKYDTKLMGFVSKVLNPYKLVKLSVSKYCFSRKIFYDFNF